ncbi:ATP dependent RNA helicase-like protein [Sporormia fimetaria CBS 119925]|uniref:RNA helicase n=1 Tax=Sporormia fimetaria CBS 119925 TaxID=1340428 RepID=A0A6A6VHR5_9PLEO|nr:ATP dependent RNA helicase-like protein [Sporormia fimetaria CBS 119925]
MAEKDDIEVSEAGLFPALYKPPGLLPIAQLKDALLYTAETYPVTIIVGETGSGKTTQIPQFLHKSGWTSDGSVVAVTQPRRIAATSVAARVAEEMGFFPGQLGQEVGYSIRFEDVTSAKTQIKFMTDGLLLREMLVDPLLKRYSVIMVDEAHERSLSSDILLSLLKKILRKRPELRVIVSSATIEAQKFLDFFASDEDGKVGGKTKNELGRIITIQGRVHPVDIQYLVEPTADYVETAVQTVMDIHSTEDKGDILLFLTGREEINDAIDKITDRIVDFGPSSQTLQPLPLYAGLDTEQQQFVFEPAPENTRKVIVSTNIAEASVTIDGIAYVIDCGFVKLRNYDPSLGIERLNVCPVSKASATQRAGRAGRTRPGKCFRLYTESAFADLPETTFPEIQRSDLAPVILQLMNLGITNVVRFDFLSPPPSKLLIRAMDTLHSLGAIDEYARLTRPLGTRMAELPLEPMLAKTLLNAPYFACLPEMLTIASMMTLQGTVFVSHDGNKKQEDKAKRRFAVAEGDHMTLYNVYESFISHGKKDAQWCRENSLNFKALVKAMSVRKQLRNHLERLGIAETATFDGPDAAKLRGMNLVERVRRCLTTGFFAHAARMKSDGTFTTPKGDVTLWVHPSSIFFHRKADWVIYHEIMETRDKTYIRDLTTVEIDWLTEYAPSYYRTKGK